MESLEDKLRALGVSIGVKNLIPKPPVERRRPIDTVIEGKDFETPFGSIFVVTQDHPQEYHQGNVALSQELDLDPFAVIGRVESLKNYQPGQFVFLDTETSGLAGGSGTFAFLVGIGFRNETGFRLMQLFMRDPADERALIFTLEKLLAPFAVVITFNGKTFDIPLLKTRYILNGFTPAFDDMTHVDLLHIARRLWRNRLESRTLGNLEVEILGVTRGEEEIPGWLVPQLYFDYLQNGDAAPLEGIFYHNAMDVLSLAGLFNVVAQMLSAPLDNPSSHNLDLVAIARLNEEAGQVEQAIELYERCLSYDLPQPFFLQTLYRYAAIYKRRGDWQAALALWEKATQFGQVEACIELAKFYEHRQRDFQIALNWTESAVQFLQTSRDHPARMQEWRADLQKRKTRLLGKYQRLEGRCEQDE